MQTIGTTGKLALRHPVEVVVGPSGSIYVLDAGLHRSPAFMKVYSPGGRLLRNWRVPRPGNTPVMAGDPAGNVYIGTSQPGVIVKYSPAGQLLARWRIGNGYLGDLAVDPTNANVLAFIGNRRIETFDGSGRLLATWRLTVGSLAVGTSGTIYVTPVDGVNGAIAVLDASGHVASRLVRAVGPFTLGPVLRAGPAGSVYAVGPRHIQRGILDDGLIQKFSPEGELLGSVRFDFFAYRVAVARDGTMYVPRYGRKGEKKGALLKLAPIRRARALNRTHAVQA